MNKEIILAKGKIEKYKGDFFINETDLNSLMFELKGDLYSICKKNLGKTITIIGRIEDDK